MTNLNQFLHDQLTEAEAVDHERRPPTDVYLAPLNTPPVEAALDPTGHLLRITDGYRWAGTLWQPRHDDQLPNEDPTQGVRGNTVWLVIQPRRLATFTDVTGEPDPFHPGRPHRYFQVITATRLTVLEQLVWRVSWLPRVSIADVTTGLVTLVGEWNPQVGVSARMFYGGPAMTDPAARAALNIGPA